MIKVLTTTQPDAENFEFRSNNTGNVITNVETVGPDFVADAYAEALAVTDWYLDGLSGDDANDGQTLATPLKTGAELQRRLGPQAAWDHNVTIHVGVGGVPDALNIIGNTLVPDVHIDIIGTPTDEIDAGTITAITAMDHTTPRSPTISTTYADDWSWYIRKRLRITSGTNAGAVSWILKENPHGLGLNVARTGRFYKILKGPTDTNVIAAVTPSIGDSVVIETLPIVNSLNLKIGGAFNSNLSTLCPWNLRQYSVENIDIESGSRDCSSDFTFYRNSIFGCKMQSFNNVNGAYGVSTNSSPLTACLLFGNAATANGVWAGGCFLANPSANMVLANPAAQPARYYYCVGQRVTFSSAGPDYFSNVQTFDTLSGYAAFYIRGNNITYSNVSSCDNVSYGATIQNNNSIIINNTVNITGTVANIRLNSSPTANLTNTFTSLTPCPDFGWSGQATLVGGTVAVVVPYVNWTDQKITISRANALGTIGDLSVPTATRTSTGFTINSANIADVSIIDWSISPSMRSIFVTK